MFAVESELHDRIDEYMDGVQHSSCEESDGSYASELSASDDEKQNYSSDNQDRKVKTKKTNSHSVKDEKTKNGENRKKTVSFEGEDVRNDHDDLACDDGVKKYDNQCSSRSEKSDCSSDSYHTENEDEKKKSSASVDGEDLNEAKRSDGVNFEGKDTHEENSDLRNSRGSQRSEDEISEKQISKGKDSEIKNPGGKSSESKDSESNISNEDDKLEEDTKVTDDFWSVSSDKGEPIHYDLGVENERDHDNNDEANLSSSPRSLRSSSSASSVLHGSVYDGKKSEEEQEKIKNKDGDSAERQGSQEVSRYRAV